MLLTKFETLLGSRVSALRKFCSQLPADTGYWALFVIFSLLLIAPIWVVTYLPLGDLPDHAAQIRSILDFKDYSDEYRVNWFTPYLMAYAITLFFCVIFSVVTSLKLVITLSLLAIPLSARKLIAYSGGDKRLVWLAFPVAFSFSLQWGFFSYVVASSVAIAMFAFTIKYAEEEFSWKNYFIAAVFSLLLFFSHALAWAFAMAVTPFIIFIYNKFLDSIERYSAFLVVLPIAVYWSSLTDMSGQNIAPAKAVVQSGFYLQHYIDRILQEVNYIIFAFNERTDRGIHWAVFRDLLASGIGKAPLPDFVALSIFLFFWPLLTGAKFRINVRRWLPFLIAASAVMIIPYSILNAFYVNTRFAVFVFPLALLLYRPATESERNARSKKVKLRYLAGYCSGILAIFICLKTTLDDFWTIRDNDQSFKAVLAHMESDKKVLMLIFNQESAMKISPPFMHFGGWYQAEKSGNALPNFAHDPLAYSVPVRYTGQPWKMPSSWNSGEFDWVIHGGDRYDYFLVRSVVPKDALFAQAGDKVKLIYRDGPWILYGKSSL